jgi:hypothetical protein
MKCEKIREMFTDHWAGLLAPDGKEQLETHLAECPFCREELESLDRLWASLAGIPLEEPSDTVRSRFYTMLEGYRHGMEPSRKTSLRSTFQKWFSPKLRFQTASQLVVGVLILSCGFISGYLIRSMRSGSQELAGLRAEVHEMRQMVTISLLKQQSASERLRGVSWSSQVIHPDPEFLSTLVHTLNYDPNVDVRLASVDALARFANDSAVRQGLIQALPKQDSPLVQISLIDLLVQLHERQSVDVFKQIIADTNQNPQVRARAQWGLKNFI